MDVVINSVKDLLKFKAVSYVNTGDKTQDNLLNSVLLSIITILFTNLSIEMIQNYINWIKYTYIYSNYTVTVNNVGYFRYIANKNKHLFKYCTWRLNEDKCGFGEEIIKLYFNIHVKVKKESYYLKCYDFKTQTFDGLLNRGTNGHGVIQDFIKCSTLNSIEPIYTDKFGIIGLLYDGENMMLAYNSNETFKSFLVCINSRLNKAIEDKETPNNRPLKIITNHNQTVGTIYPDRTFDMFVSRYKQEIISSVNSFIEANKKGSDYGGFGSYNLGIMLHGEPGSGKTLLIKALANMLKRDVLMVDMRKVKSRDKFEKLFSNYENIIYCFDEFDCVRGAIKNRNDISDANEDNAPSKELQELKNRQMELLKINTAASDKNSSGITRELADVEEKIKQLEDALTLDTVLTVLDGIIEMRGRVIIATTNYLDRIDSALLRAGRFDLKINLGNFNSEETRELLTMMYSGKSKPKEVAMIKNAVFVENKFSPAAIIHKAYSSANIAELLQSLSKQVGDT
jgi:hypothetical protein